MTNAEAGPLELLVIQSTPFCNINCSSCYLPDRGTSASLAGQPRPRKPLKIQ
jgi:hypothetical protein